MRVFISWSGEQSLAVAEALRDWLEETLQAVDPWMSGRDIRAGARWTPEINAQLSQTRFGIICLTHENQHAPWVLFEAGALAKALKDTYVVPYLIGMEPSDVEGPLIQFQAQKYSREGTLGLLKSMNEALEEAALSDDTLRRVFDRSWPDLEEAFKNIEAPAAAPARKPQLRDPEDVTREVLELVRSLSRQFKELPTRRELAALDLARRGPGFDRRRYETLEHESLTLEAARREKAELDATRSRTMEQDMRRSDLELYLEGQL